MEITVRNIKDIPQYEIEKIKSGEDFDEITYAENDYSRITLSRQHRLLSIVIEKYLDVARTFVSINDGLFTDVQIEEVIMCYTDLIDSADVEIKVSDFYDINKFLDYDFIIERLCGKVEDLENIEKHKMAQYLNAFAHVRHWL